MNPPYRTPTLALLLLAAFGASLRGGELASAAVGPVVDLPKFVVTDSRELPPPESWRYAKIPGFEILSNASDKATQRLLADFQLFQLALGYVWPVAQKRGYPVSLIVCGRGGKFDAFVPAETTNAALARASLFLHRADRTAIVIDFETTVLNVLAVDADDPASGVDSSRLSVDHNKQLYREYVRYLLSKSEPRLPAWFEEGMAQIVMAMKVGRKFIEFGKLEDPNLVSAQAALTAGINAAAAEDPDAAPLAGAPVEDRDFNAALGHRALMKLEDFFAVTHDSPEAVNPLGNNTWAKQAYAFVHLCLYGEKGKYQKQFGAFLLRAAREPVTEAMFRECFKIPDRKGVLHEMSYKDMLMELRGYIDFTVYESKEYRAKGDGLPLPPPLDLRDATPSEVGRIKGEAFVLGGHQDRAHLELIAPYIRGESDPPLLAALGLNEHAIGQDVRARQLLDAAVAAKVVRPDAHLELARFRYADALAKPAAEGARFDAAQTAAVIEPLMQACTQPPALVAVYDLMADTWVQSAVKPSRDEIGALIGGVQLFPGRMKLVYLTAGLCGQAGLNDVAQSLVAHGIRLAPDAAAKARFEALKATLPPAPPAAAVAPK